MLSYVSPKGNQEVVLLFPFLGHVITQRTAQPPRNLVSIILSILLSPGHVFTIAIIVTFLEIELWNDSGHPDTKICIWLYPTSTPLLTFIQRWVSTAPVTMFITALFWCWFISIGQEQFYPKISLISHNYSISLLWWD